MSLIFFDLDGTLTDPAEGITACIRFALEAEGALIPSQKELESFIGPPLQETFTTLLNNDQEAALRAIAKYRQRFVATGMFENRVYEGIAECLAALRDDGFRLAIATSKPKIYAEKIVEHFGLRRYFEEVFGSELDGTRTNKRDLLAYALNSLDIPAEHCLMVGDRQHDILGAAAHSIRTVAVEWGYGSQQEHLAAGAHAQVSGVSELRNACLTNHPNPPHPHPRS